MNSRKRNVLLLTGLSLVGLLQAQPITIQNPSFETATLPINEGNGPFCNLLPSSGVLAPSGGTLANWTASATIADATAGAFSPTSGGINWTTQWWNGSNIGSLQVEGVGAVSLSQTLTTTLQNGTTYTLSALIGRRAYTPRFNYAIQLWAGSTMLASASNLSLAQNSSGTDSATYYSGANNPASGEPLVIVLTSSGGAGIVTEAFFDQIALTASPGSVITNVLPQLAFGGGWYTALYFTNLTTAAVSFPVNFIDVNGNPLTVAAVGASSTSVNLPARGTTSIQIPNSGTLVQGYVTVALPSGVSGYGVFRQSVPGVPDQEAVVPLAPVTDTVTTLLFDETGDLVTGVAVVNLGSASAVNATVYDSNGNLLGTAVIPLTPNGKTAASLTAILPSTAGLTGSVDFTVSTGNVAVLGLRFNGTTFTSIPASR